MSFDKAQRLLDAAKAKGYLDSFVLIAFGMGMGVGGLTAYQTIFPSKNDAKVETAQLQARIDNLSSKIEKQLNSSESLQPSVKNSQIEQRKYAVADSSIADVADLPKTASNSSSAYAVPNDEIWYGPSSATTPRHSRKNNH